MTTEPSGTGLTPLDVSGDGQVLLLQGETTAGAAEGRGRGAPDPREAVGATRRTLVRARYGAGGVTDVQPIVSSPDLIAFARISPDRQWIAHAVKDTSGAAQIFVRRFDRPSRSVPVTPAGAAVAVWSPNGRALFYQDADSTLRRVDLTFEGEAVRPSRPLPVDGDRQVTLLDIGRDGRLLVNDSSHTVVDHVDVVVGLPELARRLRKR